MVKLLEYLSGLSVPHAHATRSGATYNAAVLLYECNLNSMLGPRGLFKLIYADGFVLVAHQTIQVDATVEAVSDESLSVGAQSRRASNETIASLDRTLPE